MASLNVKDGVLGRRLAKHLLGRCTYNITKQRIDQFAQLTAMQAVNQLFNFLTPILVEPIDPKTGATWISTNNFIPAEQAQRKRYVRSWWLHEAKNDLSIHHRLMFFLHSNFTLTFLNGTSFRFYDYLALLKFYTKGSFKELAKKVTTDGVMLSYLNNHQNNRGNPNENYAREFLELFTIGKGPQLGPGNYTNYTEYDIQQAARVLTGFKITGNNDRLNNIDPDTNIPRGYADINQHDKENKVFSDAFDGQIIKGAQTADDMWRELDDFVEMVFSKVATAQHICRKLYRYFVHRNITPEIENDIILPLANSFKNSEYNLETTLKILLSSQHFYDADDNDATNEIVGGLIKSPMELAFGAMNFFEMKAPDPIENSDNHYKVFYRYWLENTFMISASMDVFMPPDVSGYPPYYQHPDYDEAWFTSSSIIARYKLPEMLIQGRKILANGTIGGPKLSIVPWIDQHISDPSNAETIVEELLALMLPEQSTTSRKAYFLEVFLDDLSPINWRFEWLDYKESNNDSSVRIPLETLVKTIMYSQEYQMF